MIISTSYRSTVFPIDLAIDRLIYLQQELQTENWFPDRAKSKNRKSKTASSADRRSKIENRIPL